MRPAVLALVAAGLVALSPVSAPVVRAADAPAAEPTPSEWSARHILVAWKGSNRADAKVTRTKQEAQALAAQASAEAQAAGADFAALVTKYSDEPGAAARGGWLGFFERGRMTPKFQDAVEALKPGEISAPVETEFGFHVIQRLSLDTAVAMMEERAFVLRIAFFPWKGAQGTTPSNRTKEQALEDATKGYEALKAGSDFTALPAVLDARPAAPGFALALLRVGGVRPEYKALEDQGRALPVGEFGKPVETAGGWAVVQRWAYFHFPVQHFVVTHKEAARPAPGVTRTRDEARARAAEALAKFRADPSTWGAVVAAYSDEPDAGPRLGALGVVDLETPFDPTFLLAIAKLKKGEHTEVFETTFGFHVARRVD